MESLSMRVQLAGSIIQTVTQLEQVDATPILKFVFDKVLQFPDAGSDEVVRELPPPGEGEEGMGGGGGFGGRGGRRRYASVDEPVDAETLLEAARSMNEDQLRELLMGIVRVRKVRAQSGSPDFRAPLPSFDEATDDNDDI